MFSHNYFSFCFSLNSHIAIYHIYIYILQFIILHLLLFQYLKSQTQHTQNIHRHLLLTTYRRVNQKDDHTVNKQEAVKIESTVSNTLLAIQNTPTTATSSAGVFPRLTPSTVALSRAYEPLLVTVTLVFANCRLSMGTTPVFAATWATVPTSIPAAAIIPSLSKLWNFVSFGKPWDAHVHTLTAGLSGGGSENRAGQNNKDEEHEDGHDGWVHL